MRIGSLLRLYSGFNSSRSISSWNSSPAAAQNAGCHWSLSGAFFKLLPPVCVNHDSATSQFVFVHKCLVFTSFLFVFPSAIFSCLYDNLFIFLHQAVSCIPNTRNNLIVTVRIKLLTESIIKKVMIYCFFLYIITSFYFLMLFLDAAYNSAETFSGSIFLFFLQPRPLLVFLRKCQQRSIRHAIPFRRRRSAILTCHIRPPDADRRSFHARPPSSFGCQKSLTL